MKFIVFALSAILLVACDQPVKVTVKKNPSYPIGVEIKIDRITAALQVETAVEGIYESRKLAERMQHFHTPGLSIAVINDNRIEWARGFGIADDRTRDSVGIETLFQAGSVSKPVFALAVMKLKQQGAIDLDKDVNAYLTSWKVPAVEGWQPTITLRQLLSHTAGLTVHGFPGYLKLEPIPTVPQILNGEPPSNTPAVKINILPGSTFRYSGGGTTVAMLAVTDLFNKPFPQLMSEELFAPLKLKYSTYLQPLPDSLLSLASTAFPYKGQPVKGRFHVYPEMAAAGLWTNPNELAALLVEMQLATKNLGAVFMPETINEMLTPQKVAGNIGIGFFLQGEGDSFRYGHDGWDEGFVTNMVCYKNLGKGAVVMVNSNEGYDLLDEIMRSIALEYHWPDFFHEQAKRAHFAPGEIKKIVGTYRAGDQQVKLVSYDGEILSLTYGPYPPLLLVRMEDGTLRHRQMNFSIKVVQNDLTFTQAGKTTVYRRKK